MGNTKKSSQSQDHGDDLLKEIYKYLHDDEELNLERLLEERKDEYGITSDRQLSQIIGVDRNTLKRILAGEVKRIDILSVLKINQFIGLPIDKLIQLYVGSMKPEAISELEFVRKSTFLTRNFDLTALRKIGFISSVTDFHAIEQRICNFFGLDNLFEYTREVGNVLFSRTKKNSDDKLREFWVRCAFYQFEKIDNPNEFNHSLVEKFATKIKLHTRQEKTGFLTVVKALYSLGVTVIVQSYLTKIQIRGATFSVNGKPCIVVTDYRKSYDTLWFSLMHELAHVIYDFEDIKTMKYHLTGDTPDLFVTQEQEEIADYFARQLLVPDDKMGYISSFMDTPSLVKEYAKKIGIHPSIIYGFYCWDNASRDKDVFMKYSSFIPKSAEAVKAIKSDPWKKESIVNQVEEIKSQIQNL
jgi:Zn-dependent peptidase ImmA (M78 family)/transcriptional regulator with XRE-family HTH domain